MAGPLRPAISRIMAMPRFTPSLVLASIFAGLLIQTPVARAGDSAVSDIPVPSSWHYSGGETQPSSLPPVASASRWWGIFADRELDHLIDRMHAGNTTLPQAFARLAAARAQARLDTSAMAPMVGLDASASHASGPLINAAGGSGSLFTTRATVSWEADLFGKASALRQASRLEAKAAEALLADNGDVDAPAEQELRTSAAGRSREEPAACL